MNYLKERKYIDKKLVDLYNCKNSEDFYELCTGLYYHINKLVFNLEFENLKCEEKKDVFIG